MKKRFKRGAIWAFILTLLYSGVGFSQSTPDDGRTAATRLDSIRTASGENYMDIYLEADGAIKDYKAFTLDNPARIVFDLFGIKSRLKGLQKLAVEDKRTHGIRYHQYPDKVRVVVDTEKQYLKQYSVMPAAGGLQIRIEDQSAPQPQPAAAAGAEKVAAAPNIAETDTSGPGSAEPENSGNAQAPAARLNAIRTASGENYLDIFLEAEGAIKDYKAYALEDPPRIVVDLYRVEDRVRGLEKVTVDGKRARGIRYQGDREKVSLTVDTRPQYLKQYSVMPVTGGFQIRIGDQPLPESQQPAAVAVIPEAAAINPDKDAGQQSEAAETSPEAQPPVSGADAPAPEKVEMVAGKGIGETPAVAQATSSEPASAAVVENARAAEMETGTDPGPQPATSAADTLPQGEDTNALALIELLRQKGVISELEAAELKQIAGKPRPSQALGEGPAVYIVPDVPESEKQKIVKEITDKSREDIERLDQKTAAQSEDIMQRQRLTDRNVEELERKLSDINEKQFKSEWAQRIRFGGDIRLRYQGDFYNNDNALILDPNDPDSLLNTTEDRDRFRYRGRLAAKAAIIDPRSNETNVGKVDVGVRLATGNDDTPVSTNNTFGRYWLNNNVVFDQAYLRYTYKPDEPLWGDNIPQVMLTGGRIPNPWFHTDLVWDSDLNFEGAALNFYTDTQDATKLKGFLTAGAFPLQEDAFTSRCDKYLYGGQVGVEYQPRYDFAAKLGVAYYNYDNIEGKESPAGQPTKNECTAPLFFQKGNTLFDIDPRASIEPALASDYDLINITGQLDLGMFHPIHILLVGDYVENIGFDQNDVESRTGTDVDQETTGYQVGIEVGHPEVREFLDWDVFLYYKYLEADAVVDAFTDSDFHDGGTNAKGWILGGDLGLYHNVWARIRWLTSDEIKGPQLSIDTLQVDINAAF